MGNRQTGAARLALGAPRAPGQPGRKSHATVSSRPAMSHAPNAAARSNGSTRLAAEQATSRRRN
eukprot:9118876-Prorocentrum_lima.AAC.1